MTKPLVLGALFLAPALGHSQATVVLSPPNTKNSEEFTTISAVRELSNGRVIVSDEKEKRLTVIDFAKGTSTPLGRLGDGPGEYRAPAQIYAFGGDTTVVPQLYLHKWVLFADDTYAGTVSADQPIVVASGGWIRGTDAAGNFATFGSLSGPQAAQSQTQCSCCASTGRLRASTR